MVYVDDMRASFQAGYRKMIMCHMIADTDEELHAMADQVGVSRQWHQAPPRHTSHYDIALGARTRALKAGAVEITWRQAGAMTRRRRVTGALGDPATAEEWHRAHRAQERLDSLIDDCSDLFE